MRAQTRPLETIERHGFSFILRLKAIKNIHLRVYPNGKLYISAPKHCSMQHILQFLDEKQAWIEKHCPKAPPSHLHLFLGQPYAISIHKGYTHPKVSIDGQRIFCFMKSEAPDEIIEKYLKKFYKEELQKRIPPLIQKWEPIMGVRVESFYIRDMASRWGSCHTQQRRICLNLQLIKKPIECIEYVLVHEMVHLLEPSHNPRFHRLMSQFLPNWPIFKQRLSQSPEVFA
jgi:predicted metal-dependent hydrolase